MSISLWNFYLCVSKLVRFVAKSLQTQEKKSNVQRVIYRVFKNCARQRRPAFVAYIDIFCKKIFLLHSLTEVFFALKFIKISQG